MAQPQEDEWQNSWRDQQDNGGGYDGEGYGGYRRDGYGGARRGGTGGRRHDDAAISLRVTVVADNGNLCVFHKIMADGSVKPVGVPVNRISTINLSQTDGKTLIITSDGTVCVSETFEEAMAVYAAARPIALPQV